MSYPHEFEIEQAAKKRRRVVGIILAIIGGLAIAGGAWIAVWSLQQNLVSLCDQIKDCK